MIKPLLVATICAAICGCAQVDDDRIPAMPVSINLTDQGMWNVYGVSGTGMSRRFVKELGEPSGFHYSEATYTGFGGVLLFGGIDPLTGPPTYLWPTTSPAPWSAAATCEYTLTLKTVSKPSARNAARATM